MANEDKQNGIMSYSFGKPMAVEEEKAFSWYKDKIGMQQDTPPYRKNPEPLYKPSAWESMPDIKQVINMFSSKLLDPLGAIPSGQDLLAKYAKPTFSSEPLTASDASPLLSGTGVSSNDMPPLTPAEQAGVDVALEAQGNGLMSRPASDAAPTAIESPATTADTTTTANSFYQDIGEHAETDHGSTPIATADASESHLAAAARSKDVGYGHKIARGGAEDTSGIIHGIQFKNADGTYIPLTNAQKRTILEADMAANLNIARTADVGGWDAKLAEINTTWDALDSKYQNALTSLAFNVGGTKAADKWTAVLKKAKDKDITGFATDMRRKDNDQYTAGMDNRVAKELYYSGIISNLSEVATQLPLASASTSGIPE
jgi:GH24 family phage-related lysozyme (muramidase)